MKKQLSLLPGDASSLASLSSNMAIITSVWNQKLNRGGNQQISPPNICSLSGVNPEQLPQLRCPVRMASSGS
ncbi:hypothetical protein GUJ93_ZPchr0002g24346 [Zizania palustris]|uniref:Uncharacterized protein n=1 Tax=Zizania palustris TaxID=103762 RepID=A0A8J5VTJ5_ZIZPA|nr:hypothetical protein GUJ93_ZPchr0002g24346 [Zizania palustris]